MNQEPAQEPAPTLAATPATPEVPSAPVAATPAVDALGFQDRRSGPSRLRVGLVSGAALALAVGVVATSLAATPANPAAASGATGTSGSATTSAWTAPAAVPGTFLEGDAEGFGHGRFGGRGGFRDITVIAISGSSLSLETTDGWTRTIALTDDVELTKGGQAIELADIIVGDEVRLLQERADDGSISVTGVAVVVPSVVGEVRDLTATGFKVAGRDGAVWTITLTADTVYTYGAGDGTLADIANGDKVLVQGTSTGDNALTASRVAVRGDLAVGTVTATTSGTITLEDRDGASVTANVDADTIYRSAGVDAATLADIAVGDVIAVSGRAGSDGSIDADAVMEGGRGDGPGFGGGRGGHGGHGGPGFGPAPLDDSPEDTTIDAG